MTIRARFLSKVDRTSSPKGCWLWIPCGSVDKYGRFGIQGLGGINAHQAAWLLNKGPIPNGLFVCHNCPGGDDKRCVNPAHLYLGTPKKNGEDAIAKAQYRTKLSIPQAKDIRERYQAGVSVKQLADCFDVAEWTIRSILSYKSYSHVAKVKGTRKMQQLRGEQVTISKLTPEAVRDIRAKHSEGWKQADLARIYKVVPNAINMIVHRKTWRHIA